VWLNQNVQDTETIAEWVAGSYTDGGRVSSRTGLPAVVEWPFHELMQRGTGAVPDFDRREADVATIYKTGRVDEALRLIAQYEIKYVIVGQPERQHYGTAGLGKFAQMSTVAFQTPTVTIYQINAAPARGAGH
jgi:uncharacterized membrane protein